LLDLLKNPNLFRFIPPFPNLFRVFSQNRALLGVIIYAPNIKTFKKSFIKKKNAFARKRFVDEKKNWAVIKRRNENVNQF